VTTDTTDRTEYKGHLVVTGVSSGIGRAIAKSFCHRGYRVYGSVRLESQGIELVDLFGDGFLPLVFDVRDVFAVRSEVQKVVADLGGRNLTALVNNAGLGLIGPLELVDDEDFESVLSVNVLGARNVTNAFLPLLRSVGGCEAGKIVNISSLSGILNTPLSGGYCVAKHALESLGEVYRRELLEHGIDVVSIRSGPVESEIWKKNIYTPDDDADAVYKAMARGVNQRMIDAQSGALPAVEFASIVLDIIEGRKKRCAYHVGRGSKLSQILARWIPRRVVDRLIVNSLVKN